VTRWATPDGITVHTVTLSGTPAPSRPGDPAKHIRPRDYLVRINPGSRERWYIQVPEFGRAKEHTTKDEANAATIAKLCALAEREGWDTGKLAEVPTYAVVDVAGGQTYTRGGDGALFDRDTAAEFAAKRNANAQLGHERSHRVNLLTDVTDHDRV
jgi:hypothetical protein